MYCVSGDYLYDRWLCSFSKKSIGYDRKDMDDNTKILFVAAWTVICNQFVRYIKTRSNHSNNYVSLKVLPHIELTAKGVKVKRYVSENCEQFTYIGTQYCDTDTAKNSIFKQLSQQHHSCAL